jgi:hypothetical protein
MAMHEVKIETSASTVNNQQFLKFGYNKLFDNKELCIHNGFSNNPQVGTLAYTRQMQSLLMLITNGNCIK